MQASCLWSFRKASSKAARQMAGGQLSALRKGLLCSQGGEHFKPSVSFIQSYREQKAELGGTWNASNFVHLLCLGHY